MYLQFPPQLGQNIGQKMKFSGWIRKNHSSVSYSNRRNIQTMTISTNNKPWNGDAYMTLLTSFRKLPEVKTVLSLAKTLPSNWLLGTVEEHYLIWDDRNFMPLFHGWLERHIHTNPFYVHLGYQAMLVQDTKSIMLYWPTIQEGKNLHQ